MNKTKVISPETKVKAGFYLSKSGMSSYVYSSMLSDKGETWWVRQQKNAEGDTEGTIWDEDGICLVKGGDAERNLDIASYDKIQANRKDSNIP